MQRDKTCFKFSVALSRATVQKKWGSSTLPKHLAAVFARVAGSQCLAPETNTSGGAFLAADAS